MASRSELKDGRGSSARSVDAPPVDPPSTPDKLGMVQLAVGFCIALGSMLVFARHDYRPGSFLDQPPIRAMRAFFANAASCSLIMSRVA